MKHVIEPTFNIEYITEMANQTRVPVTDFSVVAVGGATKFTYGVTNRLIARARAAGEGRGSTREFLTVGVNQTYYTNPETSLFDTQYVSYSGRLKAVDLSPIAVTARLSPTPGSRRQRAPRIRRHRQRIADTDRRRHADNRPQLLEPQFQPSALYARLEAAAT